MAKKGEPKAAPVVHIQSRIVGHSMENPSDLLANPLNFRRHPGNQADALRGSMKELGWLKGVIVNRTTGHVLDGHLRCEEAMRQDQQVPVDWVELDEADERLALAVLDPITEMATRDQAVLDELLAGVTTQHAGLQALLDELAEKDTDAGQSGLKDGVDEDAVPEPPKVPITKPGDIITLGRHRLMCGDSTVITDVERLMDGAKADMVLTDPPYNVSYKGKTKEALRIQNDTMGDDAFRLFLRDAFVTADTVMKPGAVFYVWHADSEGYNFRGACKDAGWQVRQCLIWKKSSLVMGRQDYHWKHEPCLYGWKDGSGHLWATDRKQTTILEFDRPNRNGEHPTMKPVALFEYQMLNNTKGEDIVYDGFGGSGTTLIAAEKHGRDARIMELDPIYCDVIVTRWENATGQKAVRILTA